MDKMNNNVCLKNRVLLKSAPCTCNGMLFLFCLLPVVCSATTLGSFEQWSLGHGKIVNTFPASLLYALYVTDIMLGMSF